MYTPQPLVPRRKQALLPPVRFHARAYLEFSRSFSQALAELEDRYPPRRVMTLGERQTWQPLPRRPR